MQKIRIRNLGYKAWRGQCPCGYSWFGSYDNVRRFIRDHWGLVHKVASVSNV